MNDTLALFGDSSALEPMPMPDADVAFMPGFYRSPLTHELRNRLREEIPWQQQTIVIAGRERLQPRLSAWHGDPGSVYSYSGTRFEPHAWTATLLRIKADIEQATGHRFNSVLLNLYRNERDSMGWHSDNEPELGARPVIASLSLGTTRRFRFRHKNRKDQHAVSLPLNDGSLLVMAGMTQRFWRHAVERESEPKGERINLTFRNIVTAG